MCEVVEHILKRKKKKFKMTNYKKNERNSALRKLNLKLLTNCPYSTVLLENDWKQRVKMKKKKNPKGLPLNHSIQLTLAKAKFFSIIKIVTKLGYYILLSFQNEKKKIPHFSRIHLKSKLSNKFFIMLKILNYPHDQI